MKTIKRTNATIADVAQHAAVSKKTVSRVINNEPNVKPNMRARVLEAVQKLKYTPSLAARGLAHKRSFLVGLLYDIGSPDYLTLVLDSVLEKCRATGLHLLIDHFDSRAPQVAVKITSMMSQTGLDGIILIPPLSDSKAIADALRASGVPYVFLSTVLAENKHPSVNIDEFQSAFDLTRYLIGLGHRRIAFIKGHGAFSVSQQRYLGFRKAMKVARLAVDKADIYQGSFSIGSGWTCGREILSRKSRPSAIFAANDSMAAGVIAAANSLHLPVPGAVSVVGFDDTRTAVETWPNLTTVRYPMREMVAAAVELLLAQRHKADGHGAMVTSVLPHKIVERQSVAPFGRGHTP